MRFSSTTLLTLLAASAAYAQSVSDFVAQLPSCGITCLATASTAAGCGLTDYACQCGSAKSAITANATPCVASGCVGNDALKVLSISNQICAAVSSPVSSSAAAGGAVNAATTMTGSFASFATSAPASTIAPPVSTTAPAAPVQATANAGSQLRAGAVVGGVVVLAAFVL